jgi:hypothetical protein
MEARWQLAAMLVVAYLACPRASNAVACAFFQAPNEPVEIHEFSSVYILDADVHFVPGTIF